MNNIQVQEVIVNSIKEAIEAGVTVQNLWSSDTEARKALSGRVNHHLNTAKIAMPKAEELEAMIDFEVNQERLSLLDDKYKSSKASTSVMKLVIKKYIELQLPTWRTSRTKRIELNASLLGLPFVGTTAMYQVMDGLGIKRDTYIRQVARGKHTEGGRCDSILLTAIDAPLVK